MKVKRLLFTLTALAVCGVALSACRDEEQGRPLRFEKGVYAGAKDTAISEETRRDLRARAERMRH